jgi:hypothetical protein
MVSSSQSRQIDLDDPSTANMRRLEIPSFAKLTRCHLVEWLFLQLLYLTVVPEAVKLASSECHHSQNRKWATNSYWLGFASLGAANVCGRRRNVCTCWLWRNRTFCWTLHSLEMKLISEEE